VLLVVPPLYLILEDIRALGRRIFGGKSEEDKSEGGAD
jgi:hypothetical protein